MSRGGYVAVLCAALGLLSITRPASGADKDELAAQALFTDGVKALDRGDLETACAKLGESYALVKRAGSAVNLAECEERRGQFLLARGHYEAGIGLLPPSDDRVAVAKERLAALDKKLARLTIRPGAGLPADAQIMLDGKPLDASALAAAVPVDPGEHVLTATAPGRPEERVAVKLAEGEQKEITIAAASAAPPVETKKSGGNTLRTVGFIAGGIGIAGFVGAGVTGGLILSNNGKIQELCPDKRCNADGRAAIQTNETLFIANYVAWGVGIAGVGAGVALVLLSRGKSKEAPRTGVAPLFLPGGGGVSFQTIF